MNSTDPFIVTEIDRASLEAASCDNSDLAVKRLASWDHHQIAIVSVNSKSEIVGLDSWSVLTTKVAQFKE
jgi:hypothetical protein